MLRVLPVEPIEFTKSLSDVKVTRFGDNAVFECKISKDKARVQWLKDGVEIYPSAKYDITSTGRTHRLVVSRVDSRDDGDYAIIVKGHRSAGRLSVEMKPTFTNEDLYTKPLVVRRGCPVSIEVPFSSAPQPRVTWRVGGHPVAESRRMHVDNAFNATSLLIGRAERDDSGTYAVTLENSFGTLSTNIKLIVKGKLILLVELSQSGPQLSYHPRNPTHT